MYILKKKPAYVRFREHVVDGMTNNGKYIRTGKTLIDLSCFIEHVQNAKNVRKNRYNDMYDFSYQDELEEKTHNIATLLIKNKYDMSYAFKLIKHGHFTIVHLGLLSEAEQMDWYIAMMDIIRFYGRIECIQSDLYALVPLEVSYIKDMPKVNRLK